MITSRSVVFLALLPVLGCSSSKPAADPAPVLPVVTAEPVATAEPTAEPAPTVEAPPASTLPAPSGRPPMRMEHSEKISETFGSTPEAKLYLGGDQGAMMRIPEYALREGKLITFMVDKKAKKAKGGAGDVYRLYGQVPPSQDFHIVSSSGPKFEIRLPKAKLATANVAIGETKADDKGKETMVWKVVAPSKTEGEFVIFELDEFTNATIQVTSESPSP